MVHRPVPRQVLLMVLTMHPDDYPFPELHLVLPGLPAIFLATTHSSIFCRSIARCWSMLYVSPCLPSLAPFAFNA